MAEGTAQWFVSAEFFQRCVAFRWSKEIILALRIILGPFAGSVHRCVCQLLTDWNALAVLSNNFVDESVVLRLRRGHDEISLDILFQRFEIVAAVLRQ